MLSINLGGEPLILGAAPGIATAEDLRGKKVGAGRAGERNEANTINMLQQLGLDPQSDVELVNLTGGSDAWVQAILSGQVDATIMFTRHIPVVEGDGGTVLFREFQAVPQGGFGMLQPRIDADPGLPAAFMYAYIQAQRFVKTLANQEEVTEILGRQGVDLGPSFSIVYADDATLLSRDLGWNPASMDTLMADAVRLGAVPDGIEWQDHTDVSQLHVAQAALELDPNPSADFSSGEDTIENL